MVRKRVLGIRRQDAAVGELQNPIKDAHLVGNALYEAGFEVVYVEDVDRTKLLEAVERYATQLGEVGPGAVGFIYYSGHGAAKPGTDDNYLIPVSIKDLSSGGFWFQAVSLDEIQALLQEHAPNASHIVVFDACRKELRLGRGSKNFVPIRSWPSTFVAFSTGEGDVATDGDPAAAAGPYAQALAGEISQTRGTLIPVLFENVRTTFRRLFGERQFPAYTQGLTERVYFDGAARSRAMGAQDANCPEQQALDLWGLIEKSGYTRVAIEFLRECRGTAAGDLAEIWLKAVAPAVATEPIGPPIAVATDPEIATLLQNLESDDETTRRGARAALVAMGNDATLAVAEAVRSADNPSYRLQLGAAVFLTGLLRADKSLRGEVSAKLTNDDIAWLVRSAAAPDRTLRVYASEFLYDLGDPRTVVQAVNKFRMVSDDGKYNLALAIKGTAPFCQIRGSTANQATA